MRQVVDARPPWVECHFQKWCTGSGKPSFTVMNSSSRFWTSIPVRITLFAIISQVYTVNMTSELDWSPLKSWYATYSGLWEIPCFYRTLKSGQKCLSSSPILSHINLVYPYPRIHFNIILLFRSVECFPPLIFSSQNCAHISHIPLPYLHVTCPICPIWFDRSNNIRWRVAADYGIRPECDADVLPLC